MADQGVVRGKQGMGVAQEEAYKILASAMKPVYESYKFTLNNGASDVDFKVTEGAFKEAKIPRAHAVLIRSDQDITIKFNDAAQDPIEVDANIPFPYSALEMENIFLSNASGSNATVRIILG